MADVKKTSIANSVSYTIGGKEYSDKRCVPSQAILDRKRKNRFNYNVRIRPKGAEPDRRFS